MPSRHVHFDQSFIAGMLIGMSLRPRAGGADQRCPGLTSITMMYFGS
jgi:hypothetical protein